MRLILYFLAFIPAITTGQSLNMDFLSNYDIEGLPERFGANYNDVWGYKAPNGTEVAIIGGIEDIFFIDVTDPNDPHIIYTHSVLNSNGTQNVSLWRDFKTYQHYAYASADEGTSGLLIFDLSQVPTAVVLDTQITSFWSRAHNIHIDTLNARLYGAGTNTQSNGLKIINIADPDVPVQLASIALNTVGGGYVHDVYVRDNIAYCSHGNLHKLQMYDFNNLPSFYVVGTIANYPEPGYNHSSWLNEDGNYLAMIDETHGADVKLVDVTDPLDISSDDITLFYSELLGPDAPDASVAHNPFIMGDLIYVAYYHDGVQIFDMSDPEDVQLFAYYDTYPENTDYVSYEGCWGVYPYLPSGIILASDQTHGLYVLKIQEESLDIEFISFQASRKGDAAFLQWVVMDASFGKIFEVKRSSDGGKHFEKVGSVNLIDHQTHYSFTDHDVIPHQKYIYRIDFVQLDSKRISSPVRSIIPGGTPSILKIQNPVSDAIVMDVLSPIEFLEIGLHDVEGRMIWSQTIQDVKSHLEIQVEDLIPGQYILTANWPGGNENTFIQVIK